MQTRCLTTWRSSAPGSTPSWPTLVTSGADRSARTTVAAASPTAPARSPTIPATGHGTLWTRSVAGARSRGGSWRRQSSARWGGEIAAYQRFVEWSWQAWRSARGSARLDRPARLPRPARDRRKPKRGLRRVRGGLRRRADPSGPRWRPARWTLAAPRGWEGRTTQARDAPGATIPGGRNDEQRPPGRRRQLTPEQKWAVFFFEVTSQELTQADGTHAMWRVDNERVTTVIKDGVGRIGSMRTVSSTWRSLRDRHPPRL